MIENRDRFDITDNGVRSLDRLEAYLEAERFRGYDPYDALSSPLFRLPVLRSSRWLRIAAEQALKRLPVNLRPLLRIPKGYNPVTLAFVLEASAYRARIDPQRADAFRARAAECVAELARVRTGGYSGDCWGYPFDWEARYGRLPAGTPTIVATGIVTNSLFIASELLRLDGAFEMCKSAAQFVLEDLSRTEDEDDTFCWGYFPGDTQRVLNATMKGARLCAQVYS
ncbi:MAG: delta-aminolevulinic acid dehydratase, partial [Gammaproteobacteria bacterium]